MKRFLMGAVLFGAVAGVLYLATLGCCRLMGISGKSASLTGQLGLSSSQRQSFASLEKEYLAQKDASCQRLCEKRAQLIELLKAPEPDRALMANLTDEIGREQTVLEKTTLDYLMALRQQLNPGQKTRLAALVSDQLNKACQMTACSEAGGCWVVKREGRS